MPPFLLLLVCTYPSPQQALPRLDPGPETVLLDHLESLQRADFEFEWRTALCYPLDEGKSADWARPDQVSSTSLVVGEGYVHDKTARSSSADGAMSATVSERIWESGHTTTLMLDDGRKLRKESEPFQVLCFYNPTQMLLPGILIRDPSQPNAIITALRQGQIVSSTTSADTATVTFYVTESDLDRWTVTFHTSPQVKISEITCDQAVAPADKPFDERIAVHTEVRVEEWRAIDSIHVPSKITRAMTARFTNSVPKEKWPDKATKDGTLTSYEQWGLLVARPVDAVQLRTGFTQFEPQVGDFIDDRILGIGYTIGGDIIVQGTERFKLPRGEHVTVALDGRFLERLPDLQHLTAPPRSKQSTDEPKGLGSLTVWIGLACIVVGGVILLVIRRRG